MADLVDAKAERQYRKDARRVGKRFWTKLKRVCHRLPFLKELVAAYFCATDPATPFRVKAILMGALAYFVVPLDMLPDFIAFLGFTDDATVLLTAVKTVADHITPEHRARAETAIAQLQGSERSSPEV